MDKEKLIRLLSECASELYDLEYTAWYNANTMRTFKEWQSGYTKSLIDSCNSMINEIEE